MKRLLFFANFGIGQEKEYFIEQLSMLLSAGMPVVTAFSAIKKEVKSNKLKKIIEEMSAEIEGGSSISKALDLAGVFNQSTISLIKIGEQSGRLTKNLKVVAKQQQESKEFRSKTASAMMYPLFVFFLTILVGLGVTWFILPRLAVVFAQLKIELPLITRWLIGLGVFLGQYGALVIPSFIVFSFLALFFLFIYSKTKPIGQAILFGLKPVSKLMIELELSRFGSLLGSLLQAGLPVLDAIKSLQDTGSFYQYQKFYAFLDEKIDEGNSFAKCFALYKNSHKLIPISIQQLIVTSEQSGDLPETFKKIGEMYKIKTEISAKNIAVLLEPVLLVVVWLGVVAVALAVILPLYSLIGNFNNTGSVPSP